MGHPVFTGRRSGCASRQQQHIHPRIRHPDHGDDFALRVTHVEVSPFAKGKSADGFGFDCGEVGFQFGRINQTTHFACISLNASRASSKPGLTSSARWYAAIAASFRPSLRSR
jgi:hypothetical protein